MWKRLAIGGVFALTACAAVPGGGERAGLPWAPSNETLMAMAAVCSADANVGETFKVDLKLSSGMGTGGFSVDSRSRDAQIWFDYGLSLSHAFYHEDAKAAMRRAVLADPFCARCAWGEAWVLGPTLNYRIDDTQRLAALAAAMRAKALVRSGDVLGRRLIDAIIARYQPSGTSTEPAFGKEMALIAASQTEETELSVLAAHSLMMPVRTGDRTGLKPSLAILEAVLTRAPNDTAAIHYYIHGTEFDGRAEDALPYAERLGDLAPAASHLVHMPAHTYFRAGRYYEAGLVNARATGADARWVIAGGDGTGRAMGYYGHNLSFGLAGALMSGDADLALKLADHAARVWPTESRGSGAVARTWVALGLYAPDRALALPAFASGTREAAYRAYARGEAYLRKGDLTRAKAELNAFVLPTGKDEMAELVVARGVLEGRIAMAEDKPMRAAALFAAAAEVQETRLADNWDPPGWWYPVRRSLAAAYLEAGQYGRAETEALESLKGWQKDPLALWVLAEAQRRLGKRDVAARHMAHARQAWRGDLGRLSAALI